MTVGELISTLSEYAPDTIAYVLLRSGRLVDISDVMTVINIEKKTESVCLWIKKED